MDDRIKSLDEALFQHGYVGVLQAMIARGAAAIKSCEQSPFIDVSSMTKVNDILIKALEDIKKI